MLRGWNFLQWEIEVLSTAVSAYREPTVLRPRIWRDNISTMFVPELEEFARAVTERRAPAVTVDDGRRVLAVLDAVAASAQRGAPIRRPRADPDDR